jgi:hypothetical protein
MMYDDYDDTQPGVPIMRVTTTSNATLLLYARAQTAIQVEVAEEDEVEIIPARRFLAVAPPAAPEQRHEGKWLSLFDADYPGQRQWSLTCAFTTYLVTRQRKYLDDGGIQFCKACELGFENVRESLARDLDYDKWLGDASDMHKQHLKCQNADRNVDAFPIHCRLGRHREHRFKTAVEYATFRSQLSASHRQEAEDAMAAQERQFERLDEVDHARRMGRKSHREM